MFRQKAFFSGRSVGDDGVKDVAWFGPDGRELSDAEWFDPAQQTLGMYLDGRGIRTRGAHGEAVVDDSFLLVLHADPEAVGFVLPGPPWATSVRLVLDTAGTSDGGTGHAPGSSVEVSGRSLLLLRALR